tara:strand:- start:1266 stop:2186 length:921 start_codon:yes stop_codon:yes gene_type:complete
MLIRVLKRKLFTIIILFNMLFSRDDIIYQLDSIGEQRSYFSMNISPSKANIALTNSNYSNLDIIGINRSVTVKIPHINSFHSKWSPNSEKLLLMRSNYQEKKRQNGLIIINNIGSINHTIIERTNKKIYPIGWTGDNTIHYLLDEELITKNIEGSNNEWDLPLIFSIKNILYKKTSDSDAVILYEANDMILNLSYSSDTELIVFEVYGDKTIIIQNGETIIDDIQNGNAPKISPDGNMITFMVLEDDGYQITSGDIYLWDSRTGKTEPIADDPEQIGMNPIWINDHLIYYIDLRDGSLNKLLLKEH